jgi:hypothetical protein
MKKIIILGVASLLLFGGGCVSQKNDTQKEPVAEVKNSVKTFVHPKYGFSFDVPSNVELVTQADGTTVSFIDPVSRVEFGTLTYKTVSQKITFALEGGKKENVGVDGISSAFHYRQDPSGGGVDTALVINLPGKADNVLIQAALTPDYPTVDLKAVAASWKWKK